MVLKEIVLGYVAALMLVSHISLISCNEKTCIIPPVPREYVPASILRVSDYLEKHSFIDIKMLQLIGQLSLVAEALIIAYYVCQYVLGAAISYIWLTVKIVAVLVVVAFALATYYKGLPWVMSTVSRGGWETVREMIEGVLTNRGAL